MEYDTYVFIIEAKSKPFRADVTRIISIRRSRKEEITHYENS